MVFRFCIFCMLFSICNQSLFKQIFQLWIQARIVFFLTFEQNQINLNYDGWWELFLEWEKFQWFVYWWMYNIIYVLRHNKVPFKKNWWTGILLSVFKVNSLEFIFVTNYEAPLCWSLFLFLIVFYLLISAAFSSSWWCAYR